METLKLKLTGVCEMIQHNPRTVDPLSPYAIALKAVSGITKKTPEHHHRMSRIEWESSLYISDEGVIAIPARVVNGCIAKGAAKSRDTKKFKAGCFINAQWHPLTYKGTTIKVSPESILSGAPITNPELDEFFDEFVHREIVRVGQVKIMRSRAVFLDWSFETEFLYNPTIITRDELIKAAEAAGQQCGICDWIPQHGRFTVVVVSG